MQCNGQALGGWNRVTNYILFLNGTLNPVQNIVEHSLAHLKKRVGTNKRNTSRLWFNS